MAAVGRNLWADNDCQKIVSSNVSTRPCLQKHTDCLLSNDDPRHYSLSLLDDDEIRIWFTFDNLSISSYRWKSSANFFDDWKLITTWRGYKLMMEISREIDRSLICRQHTERNNSMRYWESSEKKNERTVLNRTDRLWLF
jgi:hypothetical protein